MQKKNILLILLVSILLFSCEKEIGRIDLTQNDTVIIEFDLEKDREVKFWTNLDIEYKEKPLFVYDFEFYKGDEYLLKGGTDPLITINNRDEELTVVNGITHWKFYGRLDGSFIPKSDGRFIFKTTFIRNNTPDLKINKAEIVFIK
ncbi:MAG: hypothetical protein JKX68_08725 [Flavobacteriales bacterium]|nr:hypothetical protein [Flavobacteriales bacterium]